MSLLGITLIIIALILLFVTPMKQQGSITFWGKASASLFVVGIGIFLNVLLEHKSLESAGFSAPAVATSPTTSSQATTNTIKANRELPPTRDQQANQSRTVRDSQQSTPQTSANNLNHQQSFSLSPERLTSITIPRGYNAQFTSNTCSLTLLHRQNKIALKPEKTVSIEGYSNKDKIVSIGLASRVENYTKSKFSRAKTDMVLAIENERQNVRQGNNTTSTLTCDGQVSFSSIN